MERPGAERIGVGSGIVNIAELRGTVCLAARIKPGRFDDCMKYLAGPYKALMEANKKAGLITGYAIYSATARHPNEPDLILSTTYANMAALDKIEEGEALAARVMGPSEVQNKGMADRGVMREVLGSELVRELVLK